MPPVARLGDAISHGGTIISASEDVISEGRAVARIGDKARCRKHGLVTITTGEDSVMTNGRSTAIDGSRCSCGATVIAGGNVIAGG